VVEEIVRHLGEQHFAALRRRQRLRKRSHFSTPLQRLCPKRVEFGVDQTDPAAQFGVLCFEFLESRSVEVVLIG
jgi:hypothetical protein